MMNFKIFSGMIASIGSGGYALFETLIKGSTSALAFGSALFGLLAGYYAYRVAKKRKEKEDLECELLRAKIAKIDKIGEIERAVGGSGSDE